MPQFKTSKEIYEECNAGGFFKDQECADKRKIQNIFRIALTDLDLARGIAKTLQKESIAWTTVFKLQYDVFRELVDAFVRFDCVKSMNHQCLFAFLSEKHPELEFDWGFLENIRTKRNGAQYYGEPVDYACWKRTEFQLNLYITTLKKAIEEKLRTEK